MSKTFNLPGSSVEELKKIIIGYSHLSAEGTIHDLSKIVAIHPTAISRNNKFLVDVGIIEGGRNKKATDLGMRLARALEHNQANDAANYWKESVQTNSHISGIVTTVRIKNEMPGKDLANHILYVSGEKRTRGTRLALPV